MHPVHTVVFVLFIPISMALTLFWFRLYILERWGFLDYFRHFGLASIDSWFLTPYISPVSVEAHPLYPPHSGHCTEYSFFRTPYAVLLPRFQGYPHCLLRNYLTQSNHFFSIPSLPPPSHPIPHPSPSPSPQYESIRTSVLLPTSTHESKASNFHPRTHDIKIPKRAKAKPVSPAPEPSKCDIST